MWTLVEKILNQILDGYEQEMQADLCRLLTFDTTKAEPQKMAPFGQGIADALDFVLQKAAGWGFACQNLDGYVGLVDYGSGPQQAGVLSHLDTVPIGNGWTVDAFGGRWPACMLPVPLRKAACPAALPCARFWVRMRNQALAA